MAVRPPADGRSPQLAADHQRRHRTELHRGIRQYPLPAGQLGRAERRVRQHGVSAVAVDRGHALSRRPRPRVRLPSPEHPLLDGHAGRDLLVWAPGCSARRRDAQRRFFWPSRRRSCSSAGRSSPTRRWSSSRSPRIWGLVAYAQTTIVVRPGGASRSATLACMVKIPAVLIFAPIAWLAWNDVSKHRRPRPGAARLSAHVRALFNRSGSPPWAFLSSARRCGTGTGTGCSIAPASARRFFIRRAATRRTSRSRWDRSWACRTGARCNQLGDPEFYSTILERTYYLHLTPAGFALDAFRARRLLGAPGFASRGRVAGGGAVLHPGVRRRQPVSRVSSAADAAAGGVTLRSRGRSGLRRRVAAPHRRARGSCQSLLRCAVTVIGLIGFSYSNVVDEFFRPDRLDLRLDHAGRAIERRVARRRYGDRRRVSAVRRELADSALPRAPKRVELRPELDQPTRRAAAAAAVRRRRTSRRRIWSQLEAKQPVLAEYLKLQQRIDIGIDATRRCSS